MTDFRTTAIAFLCIAGLLALAAPVAGAAVSTPPDSDAAAMTDNGTNNSSMGSEISAFMQSSASDTDGAVENGMFEAAYENASDDRSELVRDRTDDLQNDLADLRERKQRLQEEKENMSQVEYRAQMSRLVSDIRSLERAANRTEPLAEDSGVDATALREIRTNASNLGGPEVSALARQLAVVPDHVERGPPENRGPNDGNNSAGRPDDRGTGGENGSASPPDDPGNDQGPSDDNQADEDSEAEESEDDDEGNGNSGSDGSPGNGGGSDAGNSGNGG